MNLTLSKAFDKNKPNGFIKNFNTLDNYKQFDKKKALENKLSVIRKLSTLESSPWDFAKVRCDFLMVISPEFGVGQYRDGDHREDASHFRPIPIYSF